jgi:hypothetical protein
MRSLNLFVHRNQPRTPITRVCAKSTRSVRLPQPTPKNDRGDHSRRDGRRWSPRSTLLSSAGVSLLLWSALAWAFAALR